MQPSLLYVVQSYVYMCVGIQPQLQLVSQYANLQSTDMTSDQSLMKCEFFVACELAYGETIALLLKLFVKIYRCTYIHTYVTLSHLRSKESRGLHTYLMSPWFEGNIYDVALVRGQHRNVALTL